MKIRYAGYPPKIGLLRCKPYMMDLLFICCMVLMIYIYIHIYVYIYIYIHINMRYAAIYLILTCYGDIIREEIALDHWMLMDLGDTKS